MSDAILQQHIIDPEICIRCNTCEATCPIDAITHDANNYVVDAEKCNFCMACVPPCPTGAIDNWRQVPRAKAYSLDDQFSWDEMPAELPPEAFEGLDAGGELAETPSAEAPVAGGFADAQAQTSVAAVVAGASVPPWSAAHAFTNLYGPKAPQAFVEATVTGNVRVTEVGSDYDTHHIVLDFGHTPFPVLEGQSLGIIPPGEDARGKAHHARQYSVASARNGERAGYNNVSLTIKRVLEDHDGQPVRGVGSNYMCDLQVGDKVKVVGPFGASFLMPNHPKSHIVMICTGTGSAPMRAMTEWRRRLADSGKFEGGQLKLFFGARTREELPYFGPLQKLPKDFIDIHFAFSRTPGQPKTYVQDLLRQNAQALLPLLTDPNAYFYVCGLKAMEEGVLAALQDVATQGGLAWAEVAEDLRANGRLHLETY